MKNHPVRFERLTDKDLDVLVQEYFAAQVFCSYTIEAHPMNLLDVCFLGINKQTLLDKKVGMVYQYWGHETPFRYMEFPVFTTWKYMSEKDGAKFIQKVRKCRMQQEIKPIKKKLLISPRGLLPPQESNFVN